MNNLDNNLPTRVTRFIKSKWAESYKKQQVIRCKYRKEVYRNYKNDDIRELTLLEQHEIRMNNMKHIRAIYLYVNRNLLSLFSFEKKFLQFVSCIKDKSDDLTKQIENAKNERHAAKLISLKREERPPPLNVIQSPRATRVRRARNRNGTRRK